MKHAKSNTNQICPLPISALISLNSVVKLGRSALRRRSIRNMGFRVKDYRNILFDIIMIIRR
jgi:hypothetical protein